MLALVTAWWPSVLAIPGALLGALTLAGSLATLSALWTYWRRGGAAEALRLAGQTRNEFKELVQAQQETNVDIDRRLREAVADRQQLEKQVAEQEDAIADLKTRDRLKQHRLDTLQTRLTAALAHIHVLTQQLIDGGHTPPPVPPELAEHLAGKRRSAGKRAA